jgi:hypothetical protein
VTSSTAADAKEEVSLIDVIAFEDIFSDLFFFEIALVDVDSLGGGVFERDV